jgi:hypothetical protein
MEVSDRPSLLGIYRQRQHVLDNVGDLGSNFHCSHLFGDNVESRKAVLCGVTHVQQGVSGDPQ